MDKDPTSSKFQKIKKRRDIVGALILISLGLTLLLNNFGLLPPGFWQTLWRFWPVILILLGLQQIFGGTSTGEFVVAVLSMALLYFIFALTLNLPLPKPLNYIKSQLPAIDLQNPVSPRRLENTPLYFSW
jgi:hypothetical protein